MLTSNQELTTVEVGAQGTKMQALAVPAAHDSYSVVCPKHGIKLKQSESIGNVHEDVVFTPPDAIDSARASPPV